MISVMSVRAYARGRGAVHFIRGLSMAAWLAPLALAGCQDVGFEASVPPRMAPGVPITVEAVEGPPDAVQSALTAAFTQAAANHQVTVVDGGQAPRFRLKGYLTAYTAPDGKTALAYVWDLFDAANRRAQRVTGVEETSGDPADPWSRVDDRTLQRIASKSMDGIADFLASAGSAAPTTMTAKLSPAMVTGGAATGSAVGAAGKPLSFAPTQ
ncbi:hypothetical protein SAMN05519103_05251 [Rhizobiales bacterium GAS113]|nr:hypothetical protein SAMN05519103_05251 [Rhizobiales bacterium GAS113]